MTDIKRDEHLQGLSGMAHNIMTNLIRINEETRKEELNEKRLLEKQNLEDRSRTLPSAEAEKLRK